ncbi:Transcriptional activator hac1 [Apiospora kogelbergensis]|uniref:Transcriptional activator hac1 n=1 Tax=Apiospora kogelbergensis TaxID=1337665 RepID=A0AAW0QUH4_9PEZI
MESWENQTATTPASAPQVKFENSPAESFMSTPGGDYYPLFEPSADDNAADPTESVMTPQSIDDSKDGSPHPDDESPAPESGDKKPTKKRKSWGQVLPEPKTNLPPRKRAKTEDEKEQRRVERVLRNRRAAQSSRERKRQEVEALEKRNTELEKLLNDQRKQNMMLMDELNKFRRGSSPMASCHPSPLTLSTPLFGGPEAPETTKSGTMNDFILVPNHDDTIDPASISPALSPVPDAEVVEAPSAKDAPATSSASATASTDMTQHPAAVLCDLQCQSVEVPRTWTASRQTSHPALALCLQLNLLLTASSAMLSALHRPLTLIAGALKHNLALQATPSILSTIIWMVTLPPSYRTSTSPSTLVTMSAAQAQARWREATSPRSTKSSSPRSASTTLRIKSLQKLLTSSPILARPLLDATMELLRLVSEGCDDRVVRLADGSPGIKGDQQSRGGTTLLWPDGASLPSREVLLTLMWAIRVEQRNMRQQATTREATIVSRPASHNKLGSSSSVPLEHQDSNQTYVLSVATKRKRGSKGGRDVSGGKRLRLGYLTRHPRGE